jgi:hypothetical protein
MHDWEEFYGAARANRAPVARVLVASRSNVRDAVYREMERIRASALKHNVPVAVATALLYQSGWFVQWKEGPEAPLQQILERVAADGRHCDLRVVHRSRGPRLLTGPWSMAIVQCNEAPAELEHRITGLLRQQEDGLEFSPPAAWRRISTPMQHPGALRQQDPDAFQRVLVCAAAGVGSFELVGWLGDLHRAEVVHRRFAGAQDRDVGSDYVDFEQEERVWRVIAMARNGLHLPITRAFLPDYSHVVLLMCAEAERNTQLLQRVLAAFDSVQHPPALIGLATRAALHAAPSELARHFDLPYLPVVADALGPHEVWKAIEPLLLDWRDAANSSDACLSQPPLAASGQ